MRYALVEIKIVIGMPHIFLSFILVCLCWPMTITNDVALTSYQHFTFQMFKAQVCRRLLLCVFHRSHRSILAGCSVAIPRDSPQVVWGNLAMCCVPVRINGKEV